MARYSKNTPDCLSTIIFVGNVSLVEYEEHDPRYTGPKQATAVLVSDVIASENTTVVKFQQGTKCDIESRATRMLVGGSTLQSPVSECAGSIPHRLVCSPSVVYSDPFYQKWL